MITGLNLHLLWDRIDKGPPPPGRRETVIDWNRAALPASNVPLGRDPEHVAVPGWCACVVENLVHTQVVKATWLK